MSKLLTIRSSGVFVGILLLIYLLVYLYRTAEYTRKTEVVESRSGAALMRDLSKLMVLPSAQPTIVMVIDPVLLQKKSKFFAQAKEGDALFIYPDKVVIFDTHARKIVDVGLNSRKSIVASDSASQ